MRPIALLLPLLALAACNPPPSTPAERAGRSIERAGQNIRDAVDPPSGPVERAGRAIERATN